MTGQWPGLRKADSNHLNTWTGVVDKLYFINLNLEKHQDLRWKCCSPKFYLNVLIVETFLLY